LFNPNFLFAMKNNLKHYLTLILVPLLLVFSCQTTDDPDLLDEDDLELLTIEETLDNLSLEAEELTAVDRGKKRRPSFRTLSRALWSTGLFPVIARNKVTLFAPTDEAFRGLGITPKNVKKVPNLREILLYHVLKGKVLSADLVPGFVPTLNGAAVEVGLEGGVFINQAEVIRADIRCRRAVIHVIDDVLLPPTQNIVEIASDNPSFSILVAAVTKAGLAGTLSGDGPFTVFAPTDEAFVELLGILGASSLDDIPIDVLTSVLLYHVAEGRVYSSDLVSGPVTTLGGEFVVNVDNLTIDDSGSDVDANLVASLLNIQGTNGVIHVVDKVLLP